MPVARAIGSELGWDEDRIAAAAAAWPDELAAEGANVAAVLRLSPYPAPPMASALESAHLADLHALAAELGVERYRMLGREELVAAIAERDPDAAPPDRAGRLPSRSARAAIAAAGAATGRRRATRDDATGEEEPSRRPGRRRARHHAARPRLHPDRRARGGRRLRLALPDPPLRAALGRRGRRSRSPAAKGRALPGAGPRRHDQRRRAGRRHGAPVRGDPRAARPPDQPDRGRGRAGRGRGPARVARPAAGRSPSVSGCWSTPPPDRGEPPCCAPWRARSPPATTSSSPSCLIDERPEEVPAWREAAAGADARRRHRRHALG